MGGQTLKTHLWALAMAWLCAFVLCLPNFLMRAQRAFYRDHFPAYFQGWTDNGAFSTIDSFSMAEDTYEYVARIRHAAGHSLPGDPFIKSNRSPRMAATDALTFEAFGAVFRMLGDHRRAWMASQFLFALLWVPCLYAVLLMLGATPGQAAWLALLSTLYADLARVIVFLQDFLLFDKLKASFQYAFWFLGSYHYFLGPTRPTGPLFTYPCLFLAALAFVRGAAGKGKASLVLGGAAGGLLAYVHADVWAAFHGAGLLYALWITAGGGPSRRERLRPWLMLALSAALSLPFVRYGLFTSEQIALQGMTRTRQIAWGSLPSLLGAALCYRRYKDKPMGLWCGCLFLALFCACNIQVLTGWLLLQGHWYYISNTFLALVGGLWLARKLPALGETDWRWISVLTLLLALPRSIGYAGLHYWVYALPADEERAYEWLDRNTPQDSAVAALSPQTDLRVCAHTHDGVVVSFLIPIISDVSIQENARRLVYALSLYGVRLDDYLKQGLDGSRRWGDQLWLGRASQESRERSGLILVHFGALDAARREEALRQAASEPVRDYGADYLWVGAFEKSLVKDIARLPGRDRLEKVFENTAATIFRLRPSAAR
ncbi:MAG: hypothetical protein HY077_01215 [Elusimicrobia bacterium]|nr:hypothetical protein [Elusimicrobiota bacterium]